ncbi:MAG: OmpA family protein [Phycisphaerales bacterium]|nr:OmpA family protein [Phycisphaerales bacterium]
MNALTASPRAALLALVAVAGVGCVPQTKYNDLELAYRSQQQQLLRTQAELETASANENRLRTQIAQASGDLEALEALRKGQTVDVDKLLADYESLLTKIGSLNGGPLPAEVNAALSSLAAQYPEILSFDEKRGMIRFSSDFTFDSGSAGLKASAIAALKQLAPILDSAAASDLEVVVVGHTDNVPINRSAAQHPSNMHLSAHRAIGVRDALVRDGVDANRFMVAGYGEFRPVVDNGASGSAQNRRVEMYLTRYFIPRGALSPATAGVSETLIVPAALTPAAGAKVLDNEPTK